MRFCGCIVMMRPRKLAPWEGHASASKVCTEETRRHHLNPSRQDKPSRLLKKENLLVTLAYL